MEPIVHTLNRKEHLLFLNEKRYDPFTHERVTEGDRVVVCSGCQSVHLFTSWNDNERKCPVCESENTLNYIPQDNYELQFAKSREHTATTTRKKRKEEGTSKYYRKPTSAVPPTKDRRFYSKVLYILIPIILLAVVILIVTPQIFKEEIPDNQSELEKITKGEINIPPSIEEQNSSTTVRKPKNKNFYTDNLPIEIPKLGRSNLIENELSYITDTNALLKKLSYYQNIKMVLSYGNSSEIGNLDGSYVFIVNQNNVEAVFRYENNVYYNVKSTGQFSDLSNRFSGKTVIWVKDYSNIISEKYN